MASATDTSRVLSFRESFDRATGNRPFPWQEELYEKWFSRGDVPSVCNLPTGLGKTSVVATWLIALARHPDKMPRRLVYVVNRRTVVDQTTDEVEKLRARLRRAGLWEPLEGLCSTRIGIEEPPLAISTLRGQFADNREWSADPSRPAVIVGTVDMIGSRLLFSGYGIGFKSKPLHAAFLGQDALVVHDEAHLEPAFQRLITRIECEQEWERQRGAQLPWRRLQVMALSATSRTRIGPQNTEAEQPFELTPDEKTPRHIPDRPTEPIHHVWRRLTAKKGLALHQVGDVKDAVVREIARLAASYKDADAAVLVFVRTLGDVALVEKELRKTDRDVALLTGTIRGKERDELVEKSAFRRFLKNATPGTTVYLVSTSAGEVGVDLSADHMVCDLTTLESMAQRLGRVNRFGSGAANIDLVYSAESDEKDPLSAARENALKLLQELPQLAAKDRSGIIRHDGSPKALGDLRDRSDLPCRIEDAFSLEPEILDATDALFDAWALTTIRGRMPGRSPVAPYLHGVADESPQTTIAWRAELDLIDPRFADREKALQSIFTKHRIRPHETLTVGMTKQRGKWKFRAIEFLEEAVARRPDLRDVSIAVQFNRGVVVRTVSQLIDEPGGLKADPTLILPASFGGLDDKGLLSADAIPKVRNAAGGSEAAGNDDEISQTAIVASSTLDVADSEGYQPSQSLQTRMRVLINRAADGWSAHAMPGGRPLPTEWELESVYETSTRLVNHVRTQSGLAVRLVQALRMDDEGEPVCSLVCLAPVAQRQPREQQLLADHVAAVEQEARKLATALDLEEPFRSALLFAAKWHDEGKATERWQRYIGRTGGDGPLLGKSAEWRDPRLLAGYRHEFGSLLRIAHDQAGRHFANPERNLTSQQQDDARDLALHMIATHHGYGRPHFLNPVDDEFGVAECDQAQNAVVRRYARLQRKFGRWGLAYLESLLRAADAAASRAAGIDPETDDDDEESTEPTDD